MTSYAQFHGYCEPLSPVAFVLPTVAALGTEAGELPVYALCVGYCPRKEGCVSGAGNKIVFCVVVKPFATPRQHEPMNSREVIIFL